MGICIYCKQNSNTATFEGVEHVIPQAFGAFGSETPTLNCVCDKCNNYFGTSLDTYLARETVEGVVRYRKGISSSEARPQKHLKITLDAGPETGQFAGMRVVIDGTRGELMRPLTVRIENLRGHVVGSIQFYGNQIYQYILRENDSLPLDQVFGYCFTAGQVPRQLFRAKPDSK